MLVHTAFPTHWSWSTHTRIFRITDTPFSIPRNWEALERTECDAWQVFQILRFQTEGGESLNQGLEDLLALQSGEARTKAVMYPRPKGHVGVGPSGNVKPVRFRKLPGIAVRGRNDPSYSIRLMHDLSPDLYVLRSYALDRLDRGIIAEALLGRSHGQRSVLLEQLPLLRMVDERQGEVAPEI